MANAIEVHDLVKVFGQDTVLKGINRNFEAGKIHGVVGNNGSGKTVKLLSDISDVIINAWTSSTIPTPLGIIAKKLFGRNIDER